ncbi:MAG TPA: helix-turn-helix domain-containing protein [Kiloniellaceae bacterium]|nr:helix-turn-helix domain-containing protein [Kiloniellaceae bacterium]
MPSTRERILTAAYDLFYKEGFARVSMDAIANAASVTKRTLYYHFDSKDALAAAVLAHQHGYALAHVQSWRDAAARTPAAFLASLFRQLDAWAAAPRWLGSGFTRLTMELADLPGHPVREAAHRHKLAVETWLAEELQRLGAGSPEELAREVALLLEGAMTLTLIHGDSGYIATAARAADRLAAANGMMIEDSAS